MKKEISIDEAINLLVTSRIDSYELMQEYEGIFSYCELMEIHVESALRGAKYLCFSDIQYPEERTFSDGSWAYIPFYADVFVRIMAHLVKTYNITSFLDVGAGYGDKVGIMNKLVKRSRGIEYFGKYVKIARKCGIKIYHANAFKYNGYDKFDLIYMYHPIKDDFIYAKLVENIFRKMKVGGYFIEVYEHHKTKEVFERLKKELNLQLIQLPENSDLYLDKILVTKLGL